MPLLGSAESSLTGAKRDVNPALQLDLKLACGEFANEQDRPMKAAGTRN